MHSQRCRFVERDSVTRNLARSCATLTHHLEWLHCFEWTTGAVDGTSENAAANTTRKAYKGKRSSRNRAVTRICRRMITCEYKKCMHSSAFVGVQRDTIC